MTRAAWLIVFAASATAHADRTDALAKEPLAGTVVVQGNAQLWPTLAQARADHPPPATGAPFAVAVVKDHGDVVEVATGSIGDCVASFDPSYELHVFVARSALVPRSNVETVKAYRDGTAVAIDRGALVELAASGARWHDPLLAATGVAPDASRLRLSIDHWSAAALPAASGQRLACGDSGPTTREAWQKQRDALIASREREREAQLDACERAGRKTDQRSAAALATALSGTADCDQLRTTTQLGASIAGPVEPPSCGVRDRISWGAKLLPPPMLDGRPIDWAITRTDASDVFGPGTYLADLRAQCGRVRVHVEKDAVGRRSAVGTGRGGGWWLSPGPVTWPDGKLAGKWTVPGAVPESDVEVKKDRVCVTVAHLASRVCHRRKDASRL